MSTPRALVAAVKNRERKHYQNHSNMGEALVGLTNVGQASVIKQNLLKDKSGYLKSEVNKILLNCDMQMEEKS